MDENYQAMRRHRLFSAAVPAELGGGGATRAQVCAMLRELAHYDASTALTFSMHSHLLATLVWRHQHNLTPPVEPVLRRIAAEELVLVSTGGSDWLSGSGVAVKVEDGYRISGRKAFSRGAPAGHLLLTTAVYQDPNEGPTVLHFALSLNGGGVTMLDTELLGAQAALQDMTELAATDYEPGAHNSTLTYQRKTLAAGGSILAVETAMEAVGGGSFYPNLGLERCFRDVQGARLHPFQELRQYVFGGRFALGLDPMG